MARYSYLDTVPGYCVPWVTAEWHAALSTVVHALRESCSVSRMAMGSHRCEPQIVREAHLGSNDQALVATADEEDNEIEALSSKQRQPVYESLVLPVVR